MITGVDLIQEQIRSAQGHTLRLKQEDIVFKVCVCVCVRVCVCLCAFLQVCEGKGWHKASKAPPAKPGRNAARERVRPVPRPRPPAA